MSASTAFGVGMAGLGLGSSLFAARNTGSAANTLASARGPLDAAMSMQTTGANIEQQGYNDAADQTLKETDFSLQQAARAGSMFRENQALGYDSAGVLLQGSPMLALNDTVRQTQTNLSMIAAQGQAQANLLRQKAYIVGNTLRSQLLGENDSFITNQAQARISAATASGGILSNGVNGLLGAIGRALPNDPFSFSSNNGYPSPNMVP